MNVELKATPGKTMVGMAQDSGIIARVTEVRIHSPEHIRYLCCYFWDGVYRRVWLAADEFVVAKTFGAPEK